MSIRVFAESVNDGRVCLGKRDNMEKLITKHRKAAKMIGDLLSENKALKMQYEKVSTIRDMLKTSSEIQSNESVQLNIDNANLRIANSLLNEKINQMTGEIRALERTIDKLIEARK